MSVDHRALLSGEQQGLLPSATRGVLAVASGFYGLAARYRRAQFDRARRSIERVEVPVISVGNLTTGGTGKTPVVCDLCRRIRQLGIRVAIVSRGYGADADGTNDEAKELFARLPDVPHVQDVDRVVAARVAIEELESQLIVMDDGFQHRRLHRDLDLVVVDATCPFGFGWMLPRGYLREPVSSLRRADLVLVSRSDQVAPGQLQQIREQIGQYLPHENIVLTKHQATGLVDDDGVQYSLSDLQNRKVGLVSAIGNPNAFERTIRDLQANVVGHFRLADHDLYDRETRLKLKRWVEAFADAQRPELLVCTHKDAVKLATDSIDGVPLQHLQISLGFLDNAEKLEQALHRICQSVSAEDSEPAF